MTPEGSRPGSSTSDSCLRSCPRCTPVGDHPDDFSQNMPPSTGRGEQTELAAFTDDEPTPESDGTDDRLEQLETDVGYLKDIVEDLTETVGDRLDPVAGDGLASSEHQPYADRGYQ